MKFYHDRFRADNNQSYLLLKIFSIVVMVTAIGILFYFFISGNMRVHYLISAVCLLMFISGVLLSLFAYLINTEKTVELTFDKACKQVKRYGWISLGACYFSGICLFAGLIFIAQKGEIWRNSIIFFTGSILSLLICLFGLIQREMTKQHYELKKQQQETIEILIEQKSKEIKDIAGGALLA